MIEARKDCSRLAPAYDRLVAREDPSAFFDELWSTGDYWELESSAYDQGRFDAQLALLADRRYRHALEYGCGGGEFTRRLAEIADVVLGLDASGLAIERARRRVPENVGLQVVDAVEFDPMLSGPYDLVVVCETIYYLGWLRTFFEIGWLAHRLFDAVEPGGRLLLGNTILEDEKSLEAPWLIQTYRDVFVNAGFSVEREERYRGVKGGTELEALLTLFTRG